MARLSGINIIIFCFLVSAAATAHDSELDRISSYFSSHSRIGEPKIVLCTLSGGAKTQCYSTTFVSLPEDGKVGPWCPRNIEDEKGAGGVWPSSDKMYDVDGAFIKPCRVLQ